MRTRTILQRAGAVLAAVGIAALVLPARADALVDLDLVRLTDNQVDFGDDTWTGSAPLGYGSVQWDIVDGFYTPRLIGTLHLKDAKGMYARMHISYWDGGGNYIATRHGGIVHATDNDHHHWSVDLSPLDLKQITEVHVCT